MNARKIVSLRDRKRSYLFDLILVSLQHFTVWYKTKTPSRVKINQIWNMFTKQW